MFRTMRIPGIALLGLAVSGWAAPALAQQTVIIGGGNLRAPVEVNLGAIDDANRRDTFGGSAGQATPGTVRLKPPGTANRKSTAVSKAPAKAAPQTARASATPSIPSLVPPVPTTPGPEPAPTTLTPAPAPAVVTPAPVATPRPAPAAPAVAAAPPVSTRPASPAPAPVAAPPPVAAPAAPAPETRVAALPPSTSATGDVSLGFSAGEAQLSPENTRALDQLASRLGSGEDRIQIKAYASAAGAEAASSARRLSLSRALAVRSYLIDKGVRSTRIDVRALGPTNDSSPPDRVDVSTQAR